MLGHIPSDLRQMETPVSPAYGFGPSPPSLCHPDKITLRDLKCRLENLLASDVSLNASCNGNVPDPSCASKIIIRIPDKRVVAVVSSSKWSIYNTSAVYIFQLGSAQYRLQPAQRSYSNYPTLVGRYPTHFEIIR